MVFNTIIFKNAQVENKSKDEGDPSKGKSIMETEKKKKKKGKKQSETFKLYIFKVLKNTHQDIGISNKAMEIMSSFVNDMMEKIAQEASKLAKISGRNTMSTNDIETAVKLVLHGDLAKHAAVHGAKAMERFTKS